MTSLRSLRRDESGTTVIEMAIAVPILVTFLWGIFQVGIAGQAIAGMQHALGEGARYATLCVNPTSKGVCSAPTDDDIKARISSKTFGTGVGTFEDPVVSTPDASDCTKCRDLSVTFSMPLNFLLFPGPTINLTRSKRVYLST